MRALLMLAIVTIACACTEPEVSACEAQCEKRSSCGADVDIDQCRRACADSVLPGSDDCQAAQLDLQECQVQSSCDDFLADTGCDDERTRFDNSCA